MVRSVGSIRFIPFKVASPSLESGFNEIRLSAQPQGGWNLEKASFTQKGRTATIQLMENTNCRDRLPMNLRSAIDPNRGKKAILLRSPDRVIGLADALRQSGRARTFGLSEAMVIAYVRDIRFVLLRFSCLVGFGAWWYLLPEPLLVQPTACSSLSLRP